MGLVLKWAPTFNVERIDQFEKSSAFVESNDLVKRFTESGVVYVWDTTTFTQLEEAAEISPSAPGVVHGVDGPYGRLDAGVSFGARP